MHKNNPDPAVFVPREGCSAPSAWEMPFTAKLNTHRHVHRNSGFKHSQMV